DDLDSGGRGEASVGDRRDELATRLAEVMMAPIAYTRTVGSSRITPGGTKRVGPSRKMLAGVRQLFFKRESSPAPPEERRPILLTRASHGDSLKLLTRQVDGCTSRARPEPRR